MKIAIAQIQSELAQFQQNMRKHLTYIQLAIDAGADCVLFPEMALTGYSLKDLALEKAIPLESSKLDPLRKASEKIDIITGFPEKQDHTAFIASAYFSGGKIGYTHRKLYLPINGIFEDRKDFQAGQRIGTFPLRDGHLASILICRDIWHTDTVFRTKELGASVIMAPSAVPLRNIIANGPGVASFIERTAQGTAERNNQFLVFVNRVGFEEGLCFYGGSLVTDPFGKILVRGPYLEETLLVTEINWSEMERKNKILPLSYEQQPYVTWTQEGE